MTNDTVCQEDVQKAFLDISEKLWNPMLQGRIIMDTVQKGKILHRLKIIRGHLDKVIKMVEEDEYCLDILQQSTAVSSALKNVDQLILENHLKTCVKDALVTKRSADSKVEEIIKVFRAQR